MKTWKSLSRKVSKKAPTIVITPFDKVEEILVDWDIRQ